MFKFFSTKSDNLIKLKRSNKYPTNDEFVYGYEAKPKISFIINHFVSFDTLIKTIKNLKKIKITNEIIIVNDTGKNTEKIFSYLNKNNDTIINTYNLGESNGYILASKISRASDYILFSQDDDLAPSKDLWLRDTLKCFKKNKSIGLIGLNGGGIKEYKKDLTDFSKFKSNQTLFYCSWLKTGPLIFRKKVYDLMGGWERFANVGESGHFDDIYATFKVWKYGYTACLLRNKNTLTWKRRVSRDDNLTKLDLKNLKNRKITWELNKKKFLKKVKKKTLYSLERKVITANSKIGYNISKTGRII
tara:strand:+ start:1311 stop:2219 length:909 start_codon:yes stop_codon:yes gene_type:complete